MARSNNNKYFTLDIVFIVGIITLEFIWPAVTFYTDISTQFGASGEEGCPVIYGQEENVIDLVIIFHRF